MKFEQNFSKNSLLDIPTTEPTILYKDEKSHIYYLVLHKSEHSAEEFNKICNIMSEYGSSIHNMYASHSYFEEHFEPLIPDKALQKLSSL